MNTNTTTSRPRNGRLVPVRTALLLFGCLLLAACSVLGNNTRDRATVYDLDPRVQADPSWPRVDWQLSLAKVNATRVGDSLRIAVRPSANELQIYKGASWARIPTDMLEGAILRTLEDSGRIAAVARQGSGMSAQYRLMLEVRRFESDYDAPAAPPTVVIEVNAKLLHIASQRVVASRTFLQQAPTATTSIEDVVQAFDQALHAVTGEIVGWVLASGSTDAHGRST
ncbi:membrane integrity-associated transporter subunit PqiC [Lysobacter ciconiae]|uniref:Membrane integrity-associated transporter subunit PqiC n=1 Tax=Novilysobacter ciconiae TaxID=2781022 RepID=A0A7S6UF77_9GAMM|nr:ABC-type transport auxiliary lipoprotein family protein [Lysobacter ciconiae]QOW19155.1 membrane integrity-associated transporter subunit PqiC [Lysobacter ciconiae]